MKTDEDCMNTETINAIVEGVSKELKAEIKGLEKVFDEKNRSVCERVAGVERDFTQHDKRICKLEVSVAKIATKIALFSTLGGLIASIFASIVWG